MFGQGLVFGGIAGGGAPYTISYLSVAGGGSGGSRGGAGGGAGGMLTSTVEIYTGTQYIVTVGAGGPSVFSNTSGTGFKNGIQGGDSSIAGSDITSITSIGGGGGGNGGYRGHGGNGGSGGGTCRTFSIGQGTVGQGNNGGAGNGYYSEVGAGGGGAGSVGQDAVMSTVGAGGNGTASSITGSSITYAGGGGGSTYIGNNSGGAGGTGGGGQGGNNNGNPAAGGANLGGGGGGARGYNSASFNVSGAGGSGIVVLSVPTASYSGTTTGSPTISTVGSNTIIKFTGSGSYTA
jgi:hypothetical protein